MTTYQVFTSGDSLIVEMEAVSKSSPPTKISGPDKDLVRYAKQLLADPPGGGKPPSVEAIASRMGGRSYLKRKDGKPEPGQVDGNDGSPPSIPVAKDEDDDDTLAMTTSTIEVPTSSTSCWVTVYDMDAEVCTITAIAGQYHHWAELLRDDTISDPEDRFVVLVGDAAQDVQVRIRLDESGVPLALHSEFNGYLLGGLGLTLQPGFPRQFVWWFDTHQSLWLGQRPTKWEIQYPSLFHHEDGQEESLDPDSLRAPKKLVPRGRPGLKKR